MIIKSIRDQIGMRLVAVLGPEFSKLSFGADIAQNKAGKSSKRFTVSPENALEVGGVTGSNTLDHRFIIALTDSYTSVTGQINDDLKMDKTAELQDKALEVYRDLQTHRSSLGPNILIVNGLSINSIEYLDDDKVAVLRFELNIRYRLN